MIQNILTNLVQTIAIEDNFLCRSDSKLIIAKRTTFLVKIRIQKLIC